ncbi:MAG: DUF2520 domain-containing protein [Chloroflexota bacterium]
MKIGFIGAGKVGRTLAQVWHAAGVDVSTVYSLTPANAVALAARVDATVAENAAQVVSACDITFLTVPDDAIGSVALDVARHNPDIARKTVVHTSGAHSVAVLAPLADAGVVVGSLHPALPFADVETAVQAVRGATFAIETDDTTLDDQLSHLVSLLDGQVIRVPTERKALYHAALVFASNYTVTLYNIAERLLATFSDDNAAIATALNTLVTATVENLRQQGTPHALTGPLVRSDTGTIAAHLPALREFDEQLPEVYAALARQTYTMLAARGIDTRSIEQTLRQDSENHGTADNT